MAITSTEAIKFSNEQIRKVADLMAQLYNLGKSMDAEWAARGLISDIPDNSAEILHDSAYGTNGADGDGRPVVTGEDLNCIIAVNTAYITTLLEANNNEKLNAVLNVAVNTRG